jgi:hypothetical protein
MSDIKLRCALVYRLGGGKTVCVAKYDHAGQYETHGGADSSLYGGRDQSYAEAVAGVISGDPPGGLSQSGTLGGFKVVQSDQHQVVYGADTDGICKSRVFLLHCMFVLSVAGEEESIIITSKPVALTLVSFYIILVLGCVIQVALVFLEHNTPLVWLLECFKTCTRNSMPSLAMLPRQLLRMLFPKRPNLSSKVSAKSMKTHPR